MSVSGGATAAGSSRDRAGQWVMLAFRNLEAGGFVGEISDPMPVSWAGDGSALVAAAGERGR